MQATNKQSLTRSAGILLVLLITGTLFFTSPRVTEKVPPSPSATAQSNNGFHENIHALEQGFTKWVVAILPTLSDPKLKQFVQDAAEILQDNMANTKRYPEFAPSAENSHIEIDDPKHYFYLPLDGSTGNIASYNMASRSMGIGTYHGDTLDHLVILHELMHVLQDTMQRSQITTEEEFTAYMEEVQLGLINVEVEAYALECDTLLELLRSHGVTRTSFGKLSQETLMQYLQIAPDRSVHMHALTSICGTYYGKDLKKVNDRVSFTKYLTQIYASNSNTPKRYLDETTGNVIEITAHQ